MIQGVSSLHHPRGKTEGPCLSRRELLTLALAAGLLHGFPRIASAIPSGTKALLGALPNRAAAATLGRAYLAASPAEADPGRLLSLLEATLGSDASDEAALLARIDRQLRSEYIRGDLVDVDGWLLSRTEARLYALAALAEPQQAK